MYTDLPGVRDLLELAATVADIRKTILLSAGQGAGLEASTTLCLDCRREQVTLAKQGDYLPPSPPPPTLFTIPDRNR